MFAYIIQKYLIMRIGIYCRVSTEEQKTKGVSIDDQRKRGIDFCERNNYLYDVFDDGGYSGELAVEDRPALNSLLEKVYLDEIQGIFITDFDRISRDERVGFVIKKTLIDLKVKLFDTSGEINLNDETQDLLLGIKILLSSFELKKLRVRIKRSLERSVSEGRVGGGPLINYGFTKGENKMMIIDEIEADVVRYIYQLCIEGKGTKVIAQTLNENNIPTKRNTSNTGYMMVKGEKKNEFIWRDSVIYRILTNSIYKGVRMYKGKEYECPAIIESSVYDTVQVLLKERKHFVDTTNKYFYMLKGLLICAECKSKFYGKKRKDLSDNFYACSSHRHKGEWCGNKGINIDYLDKLVLTEIQNLANDVEKYFDWYEADSGNKKTMIDLAKARKSELETNQQIENLLDLGVDGTISKDVFNKRMTKLNETLEKIKKDKLKFAVQLSFLDKKEDLLRIINSHLDNIASDETSDEQKREILRAVVDKIYIQWNETVKMHTITFDYKIDHLTQFRLGKKIDLEYSTSGYRVDKRNIFNQDLFVRKVVGGRDGVYEDIIGMPVVSLI